MPPVIASQRVFFGRAPRLAIRTFRISGLVIDHLRLAGVKLQLIDAPGKRNPPFRDYAMQGRTYRYFAGKPLYPFGHGLSYTRFSYSKPALTRTSLRAGETLGVDAIVRNAGKLAGDEIVQLYLSFPDAPGMPLRALRGFRRVSLAPGASTRVHFDLSARDLSSVTQDGRRIVASGSYRIMVGGGQPVGKTDMARTVVVAGEFPLPL